MQFNQGESIRPGPYDAQAYYNQPTKTRHRPKITVLDSTYQSSHQPLRIADDGPVFPKHDAPQTVEQLVTDGYFRPSPTEPELAMLDDRRQVAWMGLDDTIGMLQERASIYQRHLDELLKSECYAFNDMARHGLPPNPEQSADYQRKMQEIATQRRQERVSFWRDTSRLRQALPESIQQYLGALRRGQILNDDEPGDAL